MRSHDFTALWDIPLPAVDEPNIENGGWSVFLRLDLEGSGFFLKRQCKFYPDAPAPPRRADGGSRVPQ